MPFIIFLLFMYLLCFPHVENVEICWDFVVSDFRDLLCLLNIFTMNTCFWHVSFHKGPDQCVNAPQVLFSSHDFDCMVYLGWN